MSTEPGAAHDVYVAVQGVASLRRGIYRYGVERHALQPIAYDTSDEEISTVIQGQDWISGGGFCVFVVVDWARYMWLYRHSRAYLNLLIQLGEFSQEVIQKASLEGYGGWMTPAIREDAAAVLLNLDSLRYDAMHFLKIGIPQHDARREDSTDTTEGGPSV